MQPSMLLRDEITSALEPELVGEVLQVLHEIGAPTRCFPIQKQPS